MKTLIKQIKRHAEAAKSAPDMINHLDAIIGACGMLEQGFERSAETQETPRTILEFTRDYHLSKANEIKLETLPADKLVAAYYDRDRLKYTAAVLDELLKRIEGKK